jgi:hypothetical protein
VLFRLQQPDLGRLGSLPPRPGFDPMTLYRTITTPTDRPDRAAGIRWRASGVIGPGVPRRAALPSPAGTATSHGRPARLGSTPSNDPCRRLRAR